MQKSFVASIIAPAWKREVAGAAVCLLICSMFTCLIQTSSGWGYFQHGMMAADALYGIGWAETEIIDVTGYADKVDIVLPHKLLSNHRVEKYQRVFESYGGDFCAFVGAESWAAWFAGLAQESYASGDEAAGEQYLGYAIHYIQDSLNPPHVFPFSENGNVFSPHTNFEEYSATLYNVGANNWQELARNAPVETIISEEDLHQRVEDAAEWVNATFQPPRCSYVSHNGTIVGDPPSKEWDMSEGDIGECINRTASLVKGVARWANPHASMRTIVVPDEYPTIQQAIDAANPGAPIYVRIGTYYENVIVNKPISLIGEDKSTTIIDGGGIGSVVTIVHDNVNVSGFTISGSDPGYSASCIFLDHSSGCTISHNTLATGGNGMCLNSSDNTVIDDNSVVLPLHVGVRGILLINSTNNLLNGNVVSGGASGIYVCGYSNGNVVSNNHVYSTSDDGIWLWESGDNILTNNRIEDVMWGFGVWGTDSLAFDNHIDTSNTVDGKPIYYVTDASGLIFDAQIDAATIYLINCKDITIRDLTLWGNLFGICFWNTTNSNIENVLAATNVAGICLTSSSGNTIADCNINYNDYGIYLWESDDNMIFHNTLTPNVDVGQQVFSYNSINTWDNGYPSGGNHWSDYTDSDVYKGPNQSETGNDGVWDHPYVIDANNQDRYPLTKSYVGPAGDVDGDHDVDIFDIVRITSTYGVKYPDQRFNRLCDMDLDGDIDIFDVVKAAGSYGRSW